MTDSTPEQNPTPEQLAAKYGSTAGGRQLSDVLTSGNARATRVFRLLDKIVTNNVQKYEHAQEFQFPFLLTEVELRSVAKEALHALELVPCATSVEFSGSSRFPDRSSQKFDNFETFLDRAGKRKDPESVQATWSRFEISEEGNPISGQISVTYYTEKKLVSQSMNLDELPAASIRLAISGSDQRWVDQTFDDLVPHVEVTKMAGILKPLWIFRSFWLVQIMSFCLGWVAYLISQSTVDRLFSARYQLEKAALIANIKKALTSEEKLDLYYEWYLTPYNSPWYREAAVFAFSLVIFAVVYFAAKALLPKLTPSSAIAIGLASRRALSAHDTFKFVVFTLIVCGLMAPIAIEIIKWLFS